MARNGVQEIIVGMVRLTIPDYSLEAFREVINNAILHRDYGRHEAVYIQWESDQLSVSSPGGFLPGITLDNLLTDEPKPRNTRLADVFRRVGLVERTGRGIDKIFAGLLRYGRPAPDYAGSDDSAVRVIMSGERANARFAQFVYEQSAADRHFRLDQLIALDLLRRERRTTVHAVARGMQRPESNARAVVEQLVEWGIAEGRGERRGRVYHLSASVFRQLGEPSGYVRTVGFERIQQEAMITEFVRAHGTIRRADVVELCSLVPRDASKILRDMISTGQLLSHGQRRGTFYTLTDH